MRFWRSRAPAKAGALAASAPSQGQGSGLRRSTAEDGFSLIEALVALTVLAIASVGLMRTVEAHIDSTRGLERRAAAMWVAENRLAEIELGGAAAQDAPSEVEMLGQQWRIEVKESETDDAEIRKLHITVFGVADRAPLASLDGFVDGRGR
ncbi:type II secretion system minor pseudopilin GspI [Sphingomonas sp. LB-2]|uniref:type II secretion system minor pseudopilin GspI n=1 Tax=Sphingomonas caeni TaxID=2984949 RepID=UPI00222E2B06|nr:type II secretion system minor pseudopilin GspI [Sphingomonas caeni]MCW3847447.1 type II secretion system minor pseudopilin GspI [Sphingomonas caeni]